MLSNNSMSALTLNGTIEERSIIVRIYVSALMEPREDIEFLLDDIQAELIEDLCGDADIGTNGIRNIEIIGIRVQYGYQTLGSGGQGSLYRVCDITLPLVVDDSAALSI